MITGVRGSGKTVFMSQIANRLSEDDDWIVIELSPERDLLTNLASRLYNTGMRRHFMEAKLDMSFLGFGLSIKEAVPVTDIDTAIEKMLKIIKDKKKRLLITIDEVVNNSYVREFSSVFQIYMRQEYPVYMLMTGLYDNIYNLQNEKTLTFLYRAPKIILQALNLSAIASSYRKIFDITMDAAKEMASYTKGYPFAFQVLGYLCYEHGGTEDDIFQEVLEKYDQYLDEYVYSKLWSELSDIDKKIIREMSFSHITGVTEIRENISMSTEAFSVYRRRLINKGLIYAEGYGRIELSLPRFDIFVKTRF